MRNPPLKPEKKNIAPLMNDERIESHSLFTLNPIKMVKSLVYYYKADRTSFLINSTIALIIIALLTWELNFLIAPKKLGPRAERFTTVEMIPPYVYRYDLVPPFARQPNEKYPLIVFLTDTPQTSVAAQYMATPVMARAFPAYLLVPRFYKRSPVGYIDDPRLTNLEQRAIFNETWPALLNIILKNVARYNMDINRIYLVADGEGSYGALRLIENAPSLFAATIIQSAYWPAEDVYTQTTPLRIYASEKDEDLLKSYNNLLVDQMLQYQTNIELMTSPSTPKQLPQSVFTQNQPWQWLFSQRNSL
jgi:predicted esterase